MKNVILLLGFLFAIPFGALSQEGYNDFDMGVNGSAVCTDQDNVYSAFVIKGPNKPLNEGSKRDLVFKFSYAGKSIIRSYRGGSWDTYLQFLTTPNIDDLPVVRMHIHENGYIGIGTTSPQNLLDVNGTIRAKEIKVESDWADFVFDDNYDLPSVQEVAAYIKEYKHLPGIPSATEVREEGVNLGEMNKKLLLKIEELTLYVIKQQQEIDELKSLLND